MDRPAPSFAQMRIVYFGLLMGMVGYAVAAAVVLQGQDGKGLATEPIPLLDAIASAAGGALAVAAFAARAVMRGRLAGKAGAELAAARHAATLLPLAMLEGGCLFCITVWLLNGHPVPPLVVALVLLALAIVVVPFSDPDAR